MAIITIPVEPKKWYIFINGVNILYGFKPLGSCTSYGSVYAAELFDNEELWLIRLLELGIIPNP